MGKVDVLLRLSNRWPFTALFKTNASTLIVNRYCDSIL